VTVFCIRETVYQSASSSGRQTMYYCIGWDKQKIATIELMYYKITKGLSRFHEKDTLVNFWIIQSNLNGL